VTEVIPGGPAATAGVAVGDRIVSIDDRDASILAPAGAFNLINGEEGTPVRLGLRRNGATLELSMTRARVVPPNITTRIVGDGIGYVRVRNFVDTGVREPLAEALRGFEAQGARAWIIDIRENPGGRHDPGAMGLFIKEGVVARDRDRAGAVHDDVAIGDALEVVRPTVVLADNRTGSVAEVFAAALQEYGVAHVIGTTTNGCVGYTNILPLGDGSSLAVTTHVNLGPISNTALNGVGVVPDEWVGRTQDDIAAGRDPQLDAAIRHLSP
jgi:carboxyl-terminal processing protease